MDLRIFHGDRQILASGALICYPGKPVLISFEEGKETLNFELHFSKDKGQTRFEGKTEGDKLILSLFNFQDSLGQVFTEPVSVASRDNNTEKIFLSLIIRTFNEDIREVVYTFYSEKVKK